MLAHRRMNPISMLSLNDLLLMMIFPSTTPGINQCLTSGLKKSKIDLKIPRLNRENFGAATNLQTDLG